MIEDQRLVNARRKLKSLLVVADVTIKKWPHLKQHYERQIYFCEEEESFYAWEQSGTKLILEQARQDRAKSQASSIQAGEPVSESTSPELELASAQRASLWI